MANSADVCQQTDPYMGEDKKCRICGFADTKNVNIFNSNIHKALLAKIHVVYPIILYEADPLPKNICKKCVYNVTFMYNDIQRVTKMQNKWVNNVRSIQPNHNYIKVLDLIENSNNITSETVKLTLGEHVPMQSINRLLLTKQPETIEQKEQNTQTCINTAQTTFAHNEAPTTSRNIISISRRSSLVSNSKTEVKKPAPSCNAMAKKKSANLPQLKNIKTILELNGCTLITIGAKKAGICANSDSNAKANDDCTVLPSTAIKDEPIDPDAEDDIVLSEIAAKQTADKTDFDTSAQLTAKCPYCPLEYNTLAALAIHQLVHLKICAPKIFEKKYLPKSVRRGRLIAMEDRKCIRCLNCWRIFVDNKSILDHWSHGECDFYCNICGKEFAQAPKMLREHVPAAHDISYRSSKLNRARPITNNVSQMDRKKPEENLDQKIDQATSEQEPLPHEEESAKTGMEEASTSSVINTPLHVQEHPKPAPSSITMSSTQSTSLPPEPPTAYVKYMENSVKCPVCQSAFQNIKARNSHMRKHKPSYQFGDVVLPPNASNDVYVNREINCQYEGIPAKIAAGTHHGEFGTFQISYISEPPEKPNPINLPGHSNNSNSNSPSTFVRGVRTKFVNRRNGPGIKVKSIQELQNSTLYKHINPTTTSTTTADNTNIKCQTWLPPDTNTDNCPPEIKEEPMDTDVCLSIDKPAIKTTAVNGPSLQTCIPCGDQFPTRLELFRHKRNCQAQRIIPCEYCGKPLTNSSSYRMHLNQVHGASA